MFGIGKKKEKNNQIINPELGVGAKIILGVSIVLFIAGFQGGLIGGFIFGGIAGGFYYMAIRLLAKYKKLPLMVEAPPLTQEQIDKSVKATKTRVKFWIIFLSVCGAILILTFLLARTS